MGTSSPAAPIGLHEKFEFASPIAKRPRLEADTSSSEQFLISTPSFPSSAKPCSGMKVLYLFAGQERKASIANILRKRGATVLEVDIIRNPKQDLTQLSQRQYYLTLISQKTWDVVITSPPCDTFSRAKMANKLGPAPTRSLGYPRGLPNLPKTLFLRNELGNILADFSWAACLAQLSHNPAGFLIKEHPEDLGVVKTGFYAGKSPASIWQWPEHGDCIKLGALSVGIRQADFGTSYVKPTRLLLKLDSYDDLGEEFFLGPPLFSEDRTYVGPIPHIKGTTSLVRRETDTGFRTSGTAAWPEKLCYKLAGFLQAAYTRRQKDTLQEPRINLTVQTPLEVAPHSTPNPSQTVTASPPELPATSSRDFPINLPPTNFNRGGCGPGRKIFLPN